MKQFFMTGLMISVMAMGLMSVAQANDDSDSNFFIGLWESVDKDDGSALKLQVADIDGDGVLDAIIGDDFFSSCLEVDQGEVGRGVLQGTGSINDEGNLVTSTKFTCFGSGREIGDLEITWVPNKEKDFLVDSESEGAWHRISTPPKSNSVP